MDLRSFFNPNITSKDSYKQNFASAFLLTKINSSILAGSTKKSTQKQVLFIFVSKLKSPLGWVDFCFVWLYFACLTTSDYNHFDCIEWIVLQFDNKWFVNIATSKHFYKSCVFWHNTFFGKWFDVYKVALIKFVWQNVNVDNCFFAFAFCRRKDDLRGNL